jgi:hypothetical protein
MYNQVSYPDYFSYYTHHPYSYYYPTNDIEEDKEESTEEDLSIPLVNTPKTQGNLSNNKKYKKLLEFGQPFRDFQEMMQTVGIRPNARMSAAEASSKDILGITAGTIPRDLATLADKDACGKVYASSFQAPALFKTYPPQGVTPEIVARYLGIRINWGKTEAGETVPMFDWKYIPKGNPARLAEERHVTSFFPNIPTHAPREAIPDDTNLYDREVDINKTLDDTLRIISAITADDQAMALTQSTDLAAKLLAKREDIRSKRRLDAENRILKNPSDYSPLSPPLDRRLQQQYLANQMATISSSNTKDLPQKGGENTTSNQTTNKSGGPKTDPPPPHQEINPSTGLEKSTLPSQQLLITVAGTQGKTTPLSENPAQLQFFPGGQPAFQTQDWRAPIPPQYFYPQYSFFPPPPPSFQSFPNRGKKRGGKFKP